jgi:hypothetical protein
MRTEMSLPIVFVLVCVSMSVKALLEHDVEPLTFENWPALGNIEPTWPRSLAVSDFSAASGAGFGWVLALLTNQGVSWFCDTGSLVCDSPLFKLAESYVSYLLPANLRAVADHYCHNINLIKWDRYGYSYIELYLLMDFFCLFEAHLHCAISC